MNKTIVILWFLIICLNKIHAQYYDTTWITPAHPTASDSIFLNDSVDLPYISMRLYYSHLNIAGGQIIINQCYDHAYGNAQVKSITETTRLGILPLGTYTGIIYGHIQYDSTDTDCSQYGIRDSIRFSFTVTQSTRLNEISERNLVISPNPTSGKLYLNINASDVALYITDMTGRPYEVPYTDREIDVSSLAAGVYVLRLQSGEGGMVRRFVKE